MRALHPDSNTGKQVDSARTQEITEAYQSLGSGRTDETSIKRRKEYDASLTLNRGPETARRTGNPLDDLVSTLFMDSLGGVFGSPYQTSRREPTINIPDGDIGLLYALRDAYKSKSPGEWEVKIPDEARKGIIHDDLIWIVKRDPTGKIFLYRTLTDWKLSYAKEGLIAIKNAERRWETEKEIPDNNLFGAKYWRNHPELLDGVSVPNQFGNYVDALMSLAKKISVDAGPSGSYDISQEMNVINYYARYNSYNYRREGSTIPSFSRPQEVIREVRLTDFWRTLNERSRFVEAKVKTTTESNNTNKPVESKGSGVVVQKEGVVNDFVLRTRPVIELDPNRPKAPKSGEIPLLTSGELKG